MSMRLDRNLANGTGDERKDAEHETQHLVYRHKQCEKTHS